MQAIAQQAASFLGEYIAREVERSEIAAATHDGAQLLGGVVVEGVGREVEVGHRRVRTQPLEQHLAALVTQPVQAKVEHLQRRIRLERPPKVLPTVRVHCATRKGEEGHSAEGAG